MSTDSGTCSFVKSADTFYQFKQCQEHNYNNNENLSILAPFREKKKQQKHNNKHNRITKQPSEKPS